MQRQDPSDRRGWPLALVWLLTGACMLSSCKRTGDAAPAPPPSSEPPPSEYDEPEYDEPEYEPEYEYAAEDDDDDDDDDDDAIYRQPASASDSSLPLSCRTIQGRTYCSEGPRDSIVELPTGSVVCGPGSCIRDGTSYSCAPTRYATIVEIDDELVCFSNNQPAECVTPTPGRCIRRSGR